MKNPLVSILIASYNKEKYVKRCIKSCLSQTYKNIEIIFIDDGSKDSSYKIAKEFKGIKAYKKKRKKSKAKFNTFFEYSFPSLILSSSTLQMNRIGFEVKN